MLDIEAYDAAESAAAEKYSNRIVQAFYPEMFVTLGYPTRVARPDQLSRYIDVMHETRTFYNIDELLKGLTNEEFELFKRVTRIVDSHATEHFGLRAHASAALLRAIHALRLIKIVTGNERPTVLEAGPGCGYLGMLLVMEGYPYISTEVVQAFYLYQSHMLSHVASSLRELAVEDRDILSIEQPKPGTAIHIPWWKWITLTPEKVKLSAGILTANHMLCEMHQSSMAYLALIGHRILSNHPGGGKVVFESWGYDLLNSRQKVAQKFAQHGLRVCLDENAMSAMVLAEGFDRRPGDGVTPQMHSAVGPKAETRRWQPIRRGIGAALNYAPPLKRLAIHGLALISRLSQPPSVVQDPSHPLARRLTDGRAKVLAQAVIREPELHAFLASHFDGEVPRLPDEVFFDLIETKLY